MLGARSLVCLFASVACVLDLAFAGCGNGEIAASDAGTLPAALASSSAPHSGTPSLGGADAAPGAIGDPCIPDQEKQATFGWFVEQEVSVQANTPQCGVNDVCLVNHFRGRVTCPYGEDARGRGPDGLAGCIVAGGTDPVIPTDEFNTGMAEIEPQCADRTAVRTVYCSCRCANASGGTDDGTYCACPSGTACTQLVFGSPLPGETDTSGAYCVKDGTRWDGGTCGPSCNPNSAPCP